MHDAHHDGPKSLRERLGGSTEERLGRAFTDLLENPLLTGAIGRAFDAREKAAQAQELAMGALNLPSAADIERLTRRLRSVSLRLEGIEDGVERLGRPPASAQERAQVLERLSALEGQVKRLADALEARPTDTQKPARAKAAKPAKGAKAAKGASAREKR